LDVRWPDDRGIVATVVSHSARGWGLQSPPRGCHEL
jgi:hypothetical protein